MEQVIIIVIIGLISLVNWLVKSSAEIREQKKKERQRLGIPEGDPFHEGSRPKEQPADSPQQAGAPAEDLRRLMEALGIPADEEVPPPLPVVRHVEPAALPPLPAFQRPPQRSKPRVEMTSVTKTATPDSSPVSPLSIALRSHEGIRQAILLREILGPPKALTC